MADINKDIQKVYTKKFVPFLENLGLHIEGNVWSWQSIDGSISGMCVFDWLNFLLN